MIRWLFLFLTSVFAGAALIYWTAHEPSYLLVSVGSWSLETSVWFALAVIITLLVVLYFGWWLVGGGIKGVASGVSKAFRSSRNRSQRNTALGLVRFIEGNWKVALRLLTKSADHSAAPVLNCLAAARCAYELGDEQLANQWLARAEGLDSNAELAVALSQARIQYLGRKFEACVATLERVRKKAPNHPMVLDVLRHSYYELQDWQALEALIPLLRKHSVINEQELKTLEKTVYRRLMEQAGAAAEPLAAVRSVWKRIPKAWRAESDLLLIYVKTLEAQGEHGEAESLIRKALQAYWDDALVLCYGLLDDDADCERRLLFAEGWLKERPGNGQLMLTLGRLAMRNQLWGKAKDYFSDSIRIQPTPDAYAEMGRLLASLGEHKESTEYYQKGLLLTTQALPDLPQP